MSQNMLDSSQSLLGGLCWRVLGLNQLFCSACLRLRMLVDDCLKSARQGSAQRLPAIHLNQAHADVA